MAPYDLHYQPKDLIPNVVYLAHDAEPSAEEKETLNGVELRYPHDSIDILCRSCGWHTYNETTSSYLSRLRVQHTRANACLWTMGKDWMLWDRTDEECGKDYMTHQFLQK
jgi:hypothetical protein